ncbi:MAG: hypothetical protein EOO27_29940, partial [Comamonadaceae bacterium]
MTARIIDGSALSQKIKLEVAERAAGLTARGVHPGLAVVLVGDSAASQVYVRNKVAACEKAGIHSVLEQYPATMTEAELLSRVNNFPSILTQETSPVFGQTGKSVAVGYTGGKTGLHQLIVSGVTSGSV